jgi:hypothetical protein
MNNHVVLLQLHEEELAHIEQLNSAWKLSIRDKSLQSRHNIAVLSSLSAI